MKTGWWSGGLMTAVVLAAGFGCAPAVAPPPMAAPAPAPAPAGTPEPTKSALSYGTVTARVERGKTTQLELLEMLGGRRRSATKA